MYLVIDSSIDIVYNRKKEGMEHIMAHYKCDCAKCTARKARKAQVEKARYDARVAGEVYVLPATRQTKPVSRLGKKARRISRIHALSQANGNLALSLELKALWDTIPEAIRNTVILCSEKHALQDCLTYCKRVAVTRYRETPLATWQSLVYKIWQTQHTDSYGFFEESHLLDIYSNSKYEVADKEQKSKRGKRRRGHAIHDYDVLAESKPLPDARPIQIAASMRLSPPSYPAWPTRRKAVVMDIPKSQLLGDTFGGRLLTMEARAQTACWHGRTLRDGMNRTVCAYCESMPR